MDEEPSSVTGRKDSLSINLEFVKVSLSRMRRSGGPTFTESCIPAKGGKIDTTLINISGTRGEGFFFPSIQHGTTENIFSLSEVQCLRVFLFVRGRSAGITYT